MSEERERYIAGDDARRTELAPVITNVIHFDDKSQLRLQVLAARGATGDAASVLYYRLMSYIDQLEADGPAADERG